MSLSPYMTALQSFYAIPEVKGTQISPDYAKKIKNIVADTPEDYRDEAYNRYMSAGYLSNLQGRSIESILPQLDEIRAGETTPYFYGGFKEMLSLKYEASHYTKLLNSLYGAKAQQVDINVSSKDGAKSRAYIEQEEVNSILDNILTDTDGNIIYPLEKGVMEYIHHMANTVKAKTGEDVSLDKLDDIKTKYFNVLESFSDEIDLDSVEKKIEKWEKHLSDINRALEHSPYGKYSGLLSSFAGSTTARFTQLANGLSEAGADVAEEFKKAGFDKLGVIDQFIGSSYINARGEAYRRYLSAGIDDAIALNSSMNMGAITATIDLTAHAALMYSAGKIVGGTLINKKSWVHGITVASDGTVTKTFLEGMNKVTAASVGARLSYNTMATVINSAAFQASAYSFIVAVQQGLVSVVREQAIKIGEILGREASYKDGKLGDVPYDDDWFAGLGESFMGAFLSSMIIGVTSAGVGTAVGAIGRGFKTGLAGIKRGKGGKPEMSLTPSLPKSPSDSGLAVYNVNQHTVSKANLIVSKLAETMEKTSNEVGVVSAKYRGFVEDNSAVVAQAHKGLGELLGKNTAEIKDGVVRVSGSTKEVELTLGYRRNIDGSVTVTSVNFLDNQEFQAEWINIALREINEESPVTQYNFDSFIPQEALNEINLQMKKLFTKDATAEEVAASLIDSKVIEAIDEKQKYLGVKGDNADFKARQIKQSREAIIKDLSGMYPTEKINNPFNLKPEKMLDRQPAVESITDYTSGIEQRDKSIIREVVSDLLNPLGNIERATEKLNSLPTELTVNVLSAADMLGYKIPDILDKQTLASGKMSWFNNTIERGYLPSYKYGNFMNKFVNDLEFKDFDLNFLFEAMAEKDPLIRLGVVSGLVEDRDKDKEEFNKFRLLNIIELYAKTVEVEVFFEDKLDYISSLDDKLKAIKKHYPISELSNADEIDYRNIAISKLKADEFTKGIVTKPSKVFAKNSYFKNIDELIDFAGERNVYSMLEDSQASEQDKTAIKLTRNYVDAVEEYVSSMQRYTHKELIQKYHDISYYYVWRTNSKAREVLALRPNLERGIDEINKYLETFGVETEDPVLVKGVLEALGTEKIGQQSLADIRRVDLWVGRARALGDAQQDLRDAVQKQSVDNIKAKIVKRLDKAKYEVRDTSMSEKHFILNRETEAFRRGMENIDLGTTAPHWLFKRADNMYSGNVFTKLMINDIETIKGRIITAIDNRSRPIVEYAIENGMVNKKGVQTGLLKAKTYTFSPLAKDLYNELLSSKELFNNDAYNALPEFDKKELRKDLETFIKDNEYAEMSVLVDYLKDHDKIYIGDPNEAIAELVKRFNKTFTNDEALTILISSWEDDAFSKYKQHFTNEGAETFYEQLVNWLGSEENEHFIPYKKLGLLIKEDTNRNFPRLLATLEQQTQIKQLRFDKDSSQILPIIPNHTRILYDGVSNTYIEFDSILKQMLDRGKNLARPSELHKRTTEKIGSKIYIQSAFNEWLSTLRQEENYIGKSDWVITAADVMSDSRIRALVDKKLGSGTHKAMSTYFQNVVNPIVSGDKTVTGFANWLSRNVRTVQLAFKPWVAFRQGLSGLYASIPHPLQYTKNTALFLMNPKKFINNVLEKSEGMRDLSMEDVKPMSLDKVSNKLNPSVMSKNKDLLVTLGYSGITGMDRMTKVIAWQTWYDISLNNKFFWKKDFVKTEKQAIRFADDMTFLSQPIGKQGYRSPFQNAEIVRMMTFYMGQQFQNYGMVRNMFWFTRRFRSIEDYKFNQVVMFPAVAMLVSQLAMNTMSTRTLPQTPEEWTNFVVSTIKTNSPASNVSDRGLPLFDIVERPGYAITRLKKGIEQGDSDLIRRAIGEDALTSIGYLTGLPTEVIVTPQRIIRTSDDILEAAEYIFLGPKIKK